MKNAVGKNIVKLRKEQGMSQEQLARKLHVTRQAVSNWETGRSQPDLDMLEALAGAFETDILVVIYGQMPASAEEEIRAAGRKNHLKKAVSWGILTLASYLILAALERHLDLLRTRTYNSLPYMLLHTLVMPLAGVGIAVTLMHVLNVAGTVRIAEPSMRKKLLLFGGLSAAFYMFCMLWLFVPLPSAPGAPLWIWHMSCSVFPHVLFFSMGLLLYLGLDM
ncbi:MAG: helix-turn-helix domain-containing protein [Clostridia bacterium]|nr:helix-turn-helix domain-containing protein [Clostridia bacterium]